MDATKKYSTHPKSHNHRTAENYDSIDLNQKQLRSKTHMSLLWRNILLCKFTYLWFVSASTKWWFCRDLWSMSRTSDIKPYEFKWAPLQWNHLSVRQSWFYKSTICIDSPFESPFGDSPFESMQLPMSKMEQYSMSKNCFQGVWNFWNPRLSGNPDVTSQATLGHLCFLDLWISLATKVVRFGKISGPEWVDSTSSRPGFRATNRRGFWESQGT